MATVINGTTGVDKVQDGSITPDDLVQKMTLMTAQASTSGTSIDFTGIPSWANRITVMFNGVSTNGTSAIQVQLGTSSGFESSGYSGAAGGIGSSVGIINMSTGFAVENARAASLVIHGHITIVKVSGNTYSESGMMGHTGELFVRASGGIKTLSGTLDRVRVTTVNGTDTFDAGTINIMYEG